jgi:hypothetical protein
MTFVWPPSQEQTAAIVAASDPVFIGLMKVRNYDRDGKYQEFITGRRAAAASQRDTAARWPTVAVHWFSKVPTTVQSNHWCRFTRGIFNSS